MVLPLVFFVLLSFMAGYFVMRNAIPITVNFLNWQFDGSLAVVLMFTLGLGGLLAILMVLPIINRQRLAIKNLKRKMKEESAQNDEFISESHRIKGKDPVLIERN